MIARPFDPKTGPFVPEARSAPVEDHPLPRASSRPIKEILRESHRESDLSYDDLLPYRAFAAWRLVRRMAAWKGMLQNSDTLIEALAPSPTTPDPWAIPACGVQPKAIGLLVPPEIIRLTSDAERLNDGFLPSLYDNPIKSIPLLPPPIPPACYPIETYNPDKDPLLRFYLASLRTTAQTLDIMAGSPENPHMGKWGMAGLLDPWRVRSLFPTRFQIVAIEQALIEETLQLLVGPEKQLGAEERLKRQYGLDRIEILSLVYLAKQEAHQRTMGDLEHARALMLLRLEDFCRRSHEAFDLRTELMAMKHMAVVLGLARAETGDMMNDMAEVVRTVSQERSKQLPYSED